MRRLLVGFLFLVACGSSAKGATPSALPTLLGTVTLNDPDAYQSVGYCEGTGGFDDLREGASVTVRDNANRVIATAALSAGVPSPDETECRFTFSVGHLAKASFYQFSITHRDAPTYSYNDLRDERWNVNFTLG